MANVCVCVCVCVHVKIIVIWFKLYCILYVYICLKIKPNSVRIRYTIDKLQHQSLSLMSSALDQSTTSAP